MTDDPKSRRIARILAPGGANPARSRDDLWNEISGARTRARRRRLAASVGGIAACLLVGAGLFWRSAAREAPVSGLSESLAVIDASLSALRNPPQGTSRARVLEESAYLLELRGQLLARSAPTSEARQ